MKSDLPLPAPTLQNFFVKNFLFLVDGLPKLDFIGWDGNLQQGKVKSAVKPNRMPSILQMLTPMTTMHCCHCNDDWEGHYHYVDAASDANPWVVTRQSLIQYQISTDYHFSLGKLRPHKNVVNSVIKCN